MSGGSPDPPWIPRLLLRLFLPGDVVGEAIRGDLFEEFGERRGGASARRRYWRQAVSVCAWSLTGRLAPARSGSPPHRFRPKNGEDEIMGNFVTDVRFALRGFVKRPAVALTALVTLALGIGANAAIFSVVNGVLLEPLPYPEPDRLVALWEVDAEGGFPTSISVPNFEDWKAAGARSFSGMTVINHTSAIVTQGGGAAERVDVAIVSHDFFDTVGIPLLHGRPFLVEEETAELTRVVILSEELWRRRFGADPGVVGQRIGLEGTSYEVVGVAPRRLSTPFLPETRMWIPAGPWRDCGRGCRRLQAVARLADGVTIARAREDLGAVAAALAEEYPEDNAGVGAAVIPLHEQLVGDVRPALLLLLGAVGFVLLLACTNVAHLFLARASARRSEIAVRAVLGASRARVVRQLMTESAVLALAAGALGLATARAAVPVLLRLAPPDVPRLDEVGLGVPVVLFTVAVTLVAGLLFGLLPAFRGSRLTEALQEARSGSGGGRVRDAMVVAEVALTLTLVVAAGLLAKSFDGLRRVDPGIRADGVLAADLALPDGTYADGKSEALYRRLLERLESLPGVESAAAIWSLPVSAEGREWLSGLSVEGQPEPAGSPVAALRPVTPGYFRTMGLPLLAGRDFTAGDGWDSPQVAIVSARMARELFPGEEAIGQRLRLGLSHRQDRIWEVVGVAGDVKLRGLTDDDRWTWYIPYAQARSGGMSLVARTPADPLALAGPLRAAVAEIAPDVVVANVRPMTDVVRDSIAPQRFNALLTAVFAGLAVFLAAVGIYGVMAFAVSQRTRELGIRMALGARPGNMVRMVVGKGLALAVAGIAFGTAGALALSRVLEGLLFGVSARDPLIFAGVGVATAAVAILASYPSARRAGRADPVEVLRAE